MITRDLTPCNWFWFVPNIHWNIPTKVFEDPIDDCMVWKKFSADLDIREVCSKFW